MLTAEYCRPFILLCFFNLLCCLIVIFKIIKIKSSTQHYFDLKLAGAQCFYKYMYNCAKFLEMELRSLASVRDSQLYE